MYKKFKVKQSSNDDIYEVLEIETIYGERTCFNDSEPTIENEIKVYQGRLAECRAYIKLREEGYM